MSGILRVFDPDSSDDETRRLSRLAQKCWSPLAIIYDPVKVASIDSTDTIPHDKAVVRALNADFVPSKRIKGRPECTIFVGNLSSKTTARTLEEAFGRYGRVVKATVVEDIITGRSRGYGFIEYSLECEALKAYECSYRTWLDGNKLFIDMECARSLPGWVPRRLGGGFNGRKESGQLRFGCRERPFKKPIKLLSEREIQRYLNVICKEKTQVVVKEDAVPVVDSNSHKIVDPSGKPVVDCAEGGRKEENNGHQGEESRPEDQKKRKRSEEENDRGRREKKKKKKHSRDKHERKKEKS